MQSRVDHSSQTQPRKSFLSPPHCESLRVQGKLLAASGEINKTNIDLYIGLFLTNCRFWCFAEFIGLNRIKWDIWGELQQIVFQARLAQFSKLLRLEETGRWLQLFNF